MRLAYRRRRAHDHRVAARAVPRCAHLPGQAGSDRARSNLKARPCAPGQTAWHPAPGDAGSDATDVACHVRTLTRATARPPRRRQPQVGDPVRVVADGSGSSRNTQNVRYGVADCVRGRPRRLARNGAPFRGKRSPVSQADDFRQAGQRSAAPAPVHRSLPVRGAHACRYPVRLRPARSIRSSASSLRDTWLPAHQPRNASWSLAPSPH